MDQWIRTSGLLQESLPDTRKPRSRMTAGCLPTMAWLPWRCSSCRRCRNIPALAATLFERDLAPGAPWSRRNRRRPCKLRAAEADRAAWNRLRKRPTLAVLATSGTSKAAADPFVASPYLALPPAAASGVRDYAERGRRAAAASTVSGRCAAADRRRPAAAAARAAAAASGGAWEARGRRGDANAAPWMRRRSLSGTPGPP